MPYGLDVTTRLLRQGTDSSSDGSISKEELEKQQRVQQHIVNAVKNALTGKAKPGPSNAKPCASNPCSFNMYAALIDLLIGSKPEETGIEEDIPWLEYMTGASDKNSTSSTILRNPIMMFGIRPSGRVAYLQERLDLKLEAIDTFSKANHDLSSYGAELEKTKAALQTILAEHHQKLSSYKPPTGTGPQEQFDSIAVSMLNALDNTIQKILGYRSTAWHRLMAVIQQAKQNRGFAESKRMLATYLQDGSIPETSRLQAGRTVFDTAIQNCTTTRLMAIARIFEVQIDPTAKYERGSDDFRKLVDTCRTTLETAIAGRASNKINSAFADNSSPLVGISYDNDVVLTRACALTAAEISQQSGFAELEDVIEYRYNPKGRIDEILGDLVVRVNQILEMLVLRIGWQNDSGGPQPVDYFQDMGPYLLYDFHEYSRAIPTSQPNMFWPDDDGNVKTTGSERPLPLLYVDQGAIRFLNCECQLYLQDNAPGQPRSICYGKGLGWTRVPLDRPGTDNANYVPKWKASCGFDWRRPYRAIYGFVENDIDPWLTWQKPSGFSALGRIDPVSQELYRWTVTKQAVESARVRLGKVTSRQMQALDALRVLAKFLRLDPSSYIDHVNPETDRVGFNEAGFAYETISINGAHFVRCNLPSVSEHKELRDFDVSYFRRIDLAFGAADASQNARPNRAWKVIKSAAETTNRPYAADVPDIYVETDKDEKIIRFGVNLPIAIQVPENEDQFRKEKANGKSKLPSIKNKGNVLRRGFYLRKNAASVMKDVAQYARSWTTPISSSLSATTLADQAFSADPSLAGKVWRTWKQTAQSHLPTDQEWCHLLGHGDGGNERVGNFVSGSRHCNSEQLAIEDGQRPTTQKFEGRYSLNATAYLIPSNTMTWRGDRSYLTTDPSYRHNAFLKNKANKTNTDKNTLEQAIDAEIKTASMQAPVAGFIRYKIRGSEDRSRPTRKILDHFFEGQSEFFDEKQFRILNAMVKFLLDDDKDKTSFFAQMAAEAGEFS